MTRRRLLRFFFTFFILIFSYALFVAATAPEISALPYVKILGAHRGDSIEYIENTDDAIAAAVTDNDYKFIEFDVQFTEDQKPVVFHDKTLLRLQGKFHSISGMTYEELQEVSEYEIPLYEEVMNQIGKSKKINVEIKSSGDEELDHELVDLIVAHSIENDYLQNLLISSLDDSVVSYVAETYPDIEAGKVYFVASPSYVDSEYLTQRLYENADEIGADYMFFHGVNLRHIENLMDYKPKDKTLGIWYFTNEIYLILKDETDGLW